MDGGYYLKRLTDLNQQLFVIIGELAQDEYAKEQLFHIVKPGEKIIQFPTQRNQKEEKSTIRANTYFTEKEISSMPKKFRKSFKTGHTKAHIRKKGQSYEIRVQIDGHRISVSSKTLDIAKKKFIQKLNEIDKKSIIEQKKNITLKKYMLEWLETTKKPYVKENTYKSYLQVYNVNILPLFGNKKLTEISPFELQKYFNDYTEKQKMRTGQKAYQLLKALFEFAVADDLLNKSPMTKVKIGSYEKETGTGLTRSEEKELLNIFYANSSSLYLQAFVFIMYTGLRRSELASAIMDEKWITVSCAKIRKGKKEKTRRIPISPMLKKVLPKIHLEEIKVLNLTVLSHEFKKALPKHHLHELRHTFITRCQECGIPREFVSVWAGHAADHTITTMVYTHLEQYEDKQLTEIAKYTYDF